MIDDMGGTKMKPRVLLVAGTGASQPWAGVYYSRITKATGAELVTLPRFGLGHTMRSVDKLVEYIKRIGEPVVLIGHSQGGLSAALVALHHPELVSATITIAAPLAGTIWCPKNVPVSSLRCMSRESRLCSSWHLIPNMYNIVGTADVVVVPVESGLLDGAEHTVYRGLGHLDLVWNKSVIDRVVQIIDGVRSPAIAA